MLVLINYPTIIQANSRGNHWDYRSQPFSWMTSLLCLLLKTTEQNEPLQSAYLSSCFLYCIACQLEAPNFAVFSNIFICLHPKIKMWQYAGGHLRDFYISGIMTPLSTDYVVSSFIGIFKPYTKINPTAMLYDNVQ